MSSKLFVVVGGQYGSEGKGAVAGRICADMHKVGRPVVNVRVGGPNAGHTVMGACPPDCDGTHGSVAHPWRLRQVPVGAVTAPNSQLVIAAGSEVDLEVLTAELRQLDAAGYGASARLTVDRSATVLEQDYIDQENDRNLNRQIGSTAKGIGAARASRIWREAMIWDQLALEPGELLSDVNASDTAELLRELLAATASAVVIEGTQGYGLGLHTPNYPYTTSGDCRAIDFLAQAGLSPWQVNSIGWETDLKVLVCLRPYPIRVAGNSGKMKGETTWSDLGLPTEYTTVTNKERRVGAWDPALAAAAIRANGGPRAGVVWVALTMMDSVDPHLFGQDVNRRDWNSYNYPRVVDRYLEALRLGVRPLNHLGYVGTGPNTALVNERMYD